MSSPETEHECPPKYNDGLHPFWIDFGNCECDAAFSLGGKTGGWFCVVLSPDDKSDERDCLMYEGPCTGCTIRALAARAVPEGPVTNIRYRFDSGRLELAARLMADGAWSWIVSRVEKSGWWPGHTKGTWADCERDAMEKVIAAAEAAGEGEG